MCHLSALKSWFGRIWQRNWRDKQTSALHWLLQVCAGALRVWRFLCARDTQLTVNLGLLTLGLGNERRWPEGPLVHAILQGDVYRAWKPDTPKLASKHGPSC